MVRCQMCGATEAHQALVDEVFIINGKYVLVEGIPASICARCGEATFSRETTQWIRRLAHGEVQPVHTVVRLGLADVQAFGLTWEDCASLLKQLGYDARVEIVAV